MSVEPKVMEHVRSVLESFGNKYIMNEVLKRNRIIEDLDAYDETLMTALLSDDLIHKNYTKKIANVEIFEVNQFIQMLEFKEYWEDSYTKYSNKIGLTAGGKFIDESEDVVLDFPFKDTVLKAGMTKEDVNNGDADEPFLNQTLAKSEIDELLEPKIFINAKRYDRSGGGANVSSVKPEDSLVIKGNNLIALHSLKKRYAGKVKLIYLDPPYNTGSDSFEYNDRFNHSTWLTFMKSRLEIARDLLSENGYIFIQTDDGELAYLKVIMDSIFGINNYVNTISILFKNIAGASGGGQDKRLKKNIEYLTVYSKNYDMAAQFNDVYDFKEIGTLVKEMRDNGVSWKYTSVLVNPGDKIYVGSTQDGSGNEIKLYERNNFEIKSISKIMNDEKISEEEAYLKYGDFAFQTAMPQSSIRPTVMKKWNELGKKSNNLMSIEYVPRSGKNKGKLYEQFYKGDNFRLFAWLRDVTINKDGKLYKVEKQGTFWNYVSDTKNVNKEGGVDFPNGKKPENLLRRIIEMVTDSDDIVMDFFLGSGSTVASAMKLNRKFIGVEQIDCQINLIKKRLSGIIGGDSTGISKDVNWQGGGSFVYAELMEKNGGFVRDVQSASSTDELKAVFTRMKDVADFDFRVDLNKFETEWNSFESFEEQKRELIRILDKNQLYYNYANIDDANVRDLISDSDYDFNQSFYGNGGEA